MGDDAMSKPDPKQINAEDIAVLARVSRLDLPEKRHEKVALSLDGVLQLFDALDAVNVGETPPTNAFDARWRVR